MTPQYRHTVVSSFLLWIDHEILSRGTAYENVSSLLYNLEDHYNAYYTYGLPYKQIVADTSIGADVLSGIYVNGTFTNVGSGDLVEINYDQGQAYFSADQSSNTLSGDYSIKDFNVSLTDLEEQELLFETQFFTDPPTTQTLTGIATNELTIPHIFVKPMGGENTEFCFGGTETTRTEFRCIVISNSKFLNIGVESILVDSKGKIIDLFDSNEMPYNSLGGWNSGVAYNYDGLAALNVGGEKLYIDKVFVSRINNKTVDAELEKINPNAKVTFVDFELTHEREPRVYS